MKKTFVSISRKIITILIMLLLTVVTVQKASSVSYPAQLYHSEEKHGKFVKGDTVYLFHSGTKDVRAAIHNGDTLAVYRITSNCEVMPVGIVKVISFVGETYLKTEVFAGEIKPDDIAKKDMVSCLVISAGVCKE